VSEREVLGRALSKELGLVYVAEPIAFTGRPAACPPAPSGREYVRVVDHRTGQFTVIAKPPNVERLHGRTVQLTRDRERGLSVQIVPGISR
jgi:hypothetical protein